MRRGEILDAQEDKRYGKGKLGSDLPDELRRRHDRLARIRQARKEMEAETAAATARQQQEEAAEARAKAAAAREADAPDAEQAELNRKAETAEAKAKAARDKAIEAAENAGVEPPDLEPLAADAMPRRGLARKADGTPTSRTQRNFTDPDSHLMQFGGSYLQGYNCQLAVDSDHQVIVATGVSNQPPDVEHLEPMLQRITACPVSMRLTPPLNQIVVGQGAQWLTKEDCSRNSRHAPTVPRAFGASSACPMFQPCQRVHLWPAAVLTRERLLPSATRLTPLRQPHQQESAGSAYDPA
jgi:hypothetical protein